MDYQEQLRDPKWKKLAKELKEKAQWQCEQCKSVEDVLHVHHKKYIKGRLAWEYHPSLLQVLCKYCHESIHRDKQYEKEIIKMEKIDYFQSHCDICGYYKFVKTYYHKDGYEFEYCKECLILSEQYELINKLVGGKLSFYEDKYEGIRDLIGLFVMEDDEKERGIIAFDIIKEIEEFQSYEIPIQDS